MQRSEGPGPGGRREFLVRGLAAGALLATGQTASPGAVPLDPLRVGSDSGADFELDEMTVVQLQQAMASGKYTSRQLVELYLARIDDVDRAGGAVGLNAVIETNPDALSIAAALDAERRTRGVRGPLHGIPILIKDNIDTADRMRTSAGSLALADSHAPADAGLVKRLRDAGAIIIGKTNLSEWANFRGNNSISGWSGRGGQTHNPYALDRNPCGSSSGTGAAISANLAAIGIGTETDGSIVCPSNVNGLVGIKPTVGLVSRAGIIPISSSQDTAGPMCRTVADAAALLTAIAGADDRDPATRQARGIGDYTRGLDEGALKGVRIGVCRDLFDAAPAVTAVFEEALAALRSSGAVLIDPVKFVSLRQMGDAEGVVLRTEFKAGINAYLATLGPSAPCKTLADLISFNDSHRDGELRYFGQETFLASEKTRGLRDAAYVAARSKCVESTRTRGIDAALARHKLTALVAPTGGPAWVIDLVNGDHFTGESSTLAAVAGYPSVTVPAGEILGLPVGVSLFGAAWDESRLIRYAYAFEQATRARRKPGLAPTLTTVH